LQDFVRNFQGARMVGTLTVQEFSLWLCPFGKSGKSGTLNRGQTERFLVFLTAMARLARVVAVHVAHHVTQRGNARPFILAPI
jgi:hypothetical protein